MTTQPRNIPIRAVSFMALLCVVISCGSRGFAAAPQVCFPPRDTDCGERLAKFINASTSTVDVAIYDLNLGTVTVALINASHRIKVRIVMDKRQSTEMHTVLPLLLKERMNVRFGRQRGVMHDKYCIVDRKRLETGSFNFTANASRNNHENSLYLDGPIVGKYQQDFELLWASATVVSSGTVVPNGTVVIP